MRLDEPVEWKGGLAAALFKGTGDPADCDDSRSILMEDTLGKHYHRGLRRRMLPALLARVTDTTCCLPGRGAEIAHMVVEQVTAWARKTHRSAGLLFVDLRAAYYGVIRQLGLDLRSGPEEPVSYTHLTLPTILRV